MKNCGQNNENLSSCLAVETGHCAVLATWRMFYLRTAALCLWRCNDYVCCHKERVVLLHKHHTHWVL